MKQSLVLFFLLFLLNPIIAQNEKCIATANEHPINSIFLNEQRTIWVGLPFRYDTIQQYPVLYVLDAEWRFNMVNTLIFDMGANRKIPPHIVVGIPHIDFENKRGIDLTFSQSRMEYDGTSVDSTIYNATNAGGGVPFFNYLSQELIPTVNKNYKTNQQNILVGHSYGGYFGSYLLAQAHPFTALQIYDPSIWYNNGEVIDRLQQKGIAKDSLNVFIAYQPEPVFHKQKIERLIQYLATQKQITFGSKQYTDETHNSLFLPSFLEGIRFLYKDYKFTEDNH